MRSTCRTVANRWAMTMLVRLSHVAWPRVSEFSKTDPGWDFGKRLAEVGCRKAR